MHWAGAGGAITSFMDRVFYAGMNSGRNLFYLKPAAAVVSARRAGTTAAFDQLNKYFTLLQMPVIASQYWNMVHGSCPEEVRQDAEGCRQCAPWPVIWPISSNAERPATGPECLSPSANLRFLPISSGRHYDPSFREENVVFQLCPGRGRCTAASRHTFFKGKTLWNAPSCVHDAKAPSGGGRKQEKSAGLGALRTFCVLAGGGGGS